MAGAIAKANDPLTKAKRQSYEGFTRFVFVGTIAVIILTGIVMMLVTSTSA